MKTESHQTKQAARQEFDGWAASYDRSILQHLVFRPSYRAFLEELVRWHSDNRRAFDLLDVGCGTGTWATWAVAAELPARRVVGLDYSARMCRMARDKPASRNDSRLQFINGDSEHLPFADGSFDMLTCSNSFHHYPHQPEVLREFRRVLRPGGRLVIIDGFRDNLIGWIAFDVIVSGVEGRVHHASWSQMRQWSLTAGFREVSQRKLGVWIPLLVTMAAA